MNGNSNTPIFETINYSKTGKNKLNYKLTSNENQLAGSESKPKLVPIDLHDQLDCTQRSIANLRKDIRVILREELQFFLRKLCDNYSAVQQDGDFKHGYL